MRSVRLGLLAMALLAGKAEAAELAVLTAGAFKPVIVAVQPGFEAAHGDHLTIRNDTAGAIAKRIAGGEAFDLVVSTQDGIAQLVAAGKIIPGSATRLARVAIGVAVKAGAPLPSIGTVEEFKQALLAAPSVAYLDPAAGGSSGIYLTGLFERMGITAQIKPKAVLVNGGLVAERLVDGSAALAVHQISELKAVPGVVIVGPIPDAVQNYTDYSGGVSSGSPAPASASALLSMLSNSGALLSEKGMQSPPPN